MSAFTTHTEENAGLQQPVRRGDNFLQTSFSEFVGLLFSKWWLFAIIAAMAGAVGFFWAKMQKIQYESNLTFVVDEEGAGGGISGAISLAAQLGLNIGSSEDIFSGDNILEIIKSRRLVEQVLLSKDTFDNKEFTLAEYYLQQSGNRRKDVHFQYGQPRNTFSYTQDSLLYELYGEFAGEFITADRPDKRLNILSVKVRNGNEKFAKVFTDKLIKAADSFYIEISSRKTRETLEILENRVALMKGNLNSSISSRAATEDANLNPAFAAAEAPKQKQQVDIQVYGAAYGELYKNLELARFQYLKKIPLVQIIDDVKYPLKKVKPGKIKTAVIFAWGAVFVVAFLLWLIRIYRLYR